MRHLITALTGWALALLFAVLAFAPADWAGVVPTRYAVYALCVVVAVAMIVTAFRGSNTKPVLVADLAVFAPDTMGRLHVLLIQRGHDPYAGHWALPGGKLDGRDTTLADAARRELAEETGITAPATLTPVGVWDDPGRDPRGRFVSAAYTADLDLLRHPAAGSDAANAQWVPVDQVGTHYQLAFDHDQIISAALTVRSGQNRTAEQ